MAFVNFIIMAIVLGLVIGLINAIPMTNFIKGLVNLLFFIMLVLYILQYTGLMSPLLPMIQPFH